ncbi:MAG: rhodanese-like domain-containing protein [Armatimonadota bacterium]|nr:hypothetical protein [bacterium]
MRQRFSNFVLMLINLCLGSFVMLVLCAGTGLTVNKLRHDGVALAANPGGAPDIEHYKRNELLYVRSKSTKTSLLSECIFVDTRPLSQYKKRHIADASHYSMVDMFTVSSPIVLYGRSNNLKKTKSVALKTLLATSQPVFIMIDGFDGWKKNDLPTENSKF